MSAETSHYSLVVLWHRTSESLCKPVGRSTETAERHQIADWGNLWKPLSRSIYTCRVWRKRHQISEWKNLKETSRYRSLENGERYSITEGAPLEGRVHSKLGNVYTYKYTVGMNKIYLEISSLVDSMQIYKAAPKISHDNWLFKHSSGTIATIGVNPGARGSDPQILGVGLVGSPWNIIVSYNVQEYETRTLSKSADFSEIERFV